MSHLLTTPARLCKVTLVICLFLPSVASASPVLVVHRSGVVERDLPTLPSQSATTLPRPQGTLARPSFAPTSTTSGITIPSAVKQAASDGSISGEDRSNYLTIYRATRRAYAQLSGSNKTELGDVLATAQGVARRNQLTPSRMPALFLTLERNRQWWSVRGAPATGARVSFAGSRVVFQYYPGHGLQLQMLANFGNANGLWSAKKYDAFKDLLGDLIALKSTRSGFQTWEYYFPFGGGQPPWTSGMSQGAALQALSRAGTTFGDDSYFEVAKSALGIYNSSTPAGVRVSQSQGAWYALYSFAPRQYVLNGDLEALIGLFDFNRADPGTAAAQLLQDGDEGTRARLKRCDTGAWSLYQCPGAEADLNYQQVTTDFLKKLCSRTDAEIYCSAADRFSDYLKTPPKITDANFKPTSAKPLKPAKVSFNLSKISTVTLRIAGPTGDTVFIHSYKLAYGYRTLGWTTPSKSGAYTWTLNAIDLAGNNTDGPVTGTIRVT